VCLEVHPLPESPPTGDMKRLILMGWPSGQTETVWAHEWQTEGRGAIWWSELPVLPDPGDRLTTEHAELVLGEARQRDGVPHSYWVKVSDAAARLRRALYTL